MISPIKLGIPKCSPKQVFDAFSALSVYLFPPENSFFLLLSFAGENPLEKGWVKAGLNEVQQQRRREGD